jgi:hypothetical protein
MRKPFLFSSALKSFLRCWDTWGARQLVYITGEKQVPELIAEPNHSAVTLSPTIKDYFIIPQNCCIKRSVADAGQFYSLFSFPVASPLCTGIHSLTRNFHDLKCATDVFDKEWW